MTDPGAVARGIEVIEQIGGAPSAAEDEPAPPVFLLSTAWRTGSTLLQRIMATDRRILIWGEPLSELDLLPRLAAALAAGSPGMAEEWRPIEAHSDLATSWTANTFPPGADLRAALRAFLDRWLGAPAAEHGYARWGLKEARLGAGEAQLLRWLYPRAPVVVMTRDPRDAYRSLVSMRWRRRPVATADEFARLWAALAASWRRPDAPDHMLLRYEDVAAGTVDFRALERQLGLRLREREALDVVLRGGESDERALTPGEVAAIERHAAAEMQALGYGS